MTRLAVIILVLANLAAGAAEAGGGNGTQGDPAARSLAAVETPAPHLSPPGPEGPRGRTVRPTVSYTVDLPSKGGTILYRKYVPIRGAPVLRARPVLDTDYLAGVHAQRGGWLATGDSYNTEPGSGISFLGACDPSQWGQRAWVYHPTFGPYYAICWPGVYYGNGWWGDFRWR